MRSPDPDPDFICSHCKECKALSIKVDADIDKLSNGAVIINKRLEEYKSIINSLKEQLVAIKKELFSYKAKPSNYEKGSSFELENRINDGAVQNDNPIRPTYLKEAGKPMSSSEFTEKLPARVVLNHTRRMRLVCIGVPKHMDDRTFIQELSEELNLDLDNSKIKKTFRIQAKNIPAGKTLPLNIEFYSTSDRSNILSQVTTDKIANLPSNSKFRHVKFFPDRSYKHRKKYNELKLEMDARNSQLFKHAKTRPSLKWTIKNMSLIKVINFGGWVKNQ